MGHGKGWARSWNGYYIEGSVSNLFSKDVSEWGEWKNGERHEGMYYSLITLTKKAAASFAVPLALLLLDATGYVPVISEQPASALWGIRIVIGPIPAVLLCIGILFAFRYPLDREKYAQIVRELEDRRGFTKETSNNLFK